MMTSIACNVCPLNEKKPVLGVHHTDLLGRAASCVFLLLQFLQAKRKMWVKADNHIVLDVIDLINQWWWSFFQFFKNSLLWPTLTMRGRVTISTRPLSGKLTISLSQEAWDGMASAVTLTFTTPKKTSIKNGCSDSLLLRKNFNFGRIKLWIFFVTCSLCYYFSLK